METPEQKRPVGRPRYFQTPQAFMDKATEYFEQCKLLKEHPRITGLCLYLGFTSRAELGDYAGYEGFAGVVGWARMMVEDGYEKRLAEAKPTGAIFALKNMGWRDEKNIDVKSSDGSMSPKSSPVNIDTSKLTTEQLAAFWSAVKPADNADQSR